TRSSHDNCRESDRELRVQSGTRIIELLVSFDSEVRYERAANSGELRNRDTSGSQRARGPARRRPEPLDQGLGTVDRGQAGLHVAQPVEIGLGVVLPEGELSLF